MTRLEQAVRVRAFIDDIDLDTATGKVICETADCIREKKAVTFDDLFGDSREERK